MFGAEEPFKGREIVVAMLMRVLKLMNVPSLREVLLIDVFISLQPAHALEDSAIRFVNFHRLNLLVAIKSVFYFGGDPIGLIINAWMSIRMM